MPNSIRSTAVQGGAQAIAGDLVLLPLLMSVSKTYRQFVALKLAEIGVMVGQDQFLDLLDPQEQCSIQEAAHRLNVRPSTVSKMVDRFQENGWATRSGHARDQRKVLVVLTEKGSEVREQVREIWAAVESEIVAAMPPAGDQDPRFEELRQIDAALLGRLSRLR